MGSCAVSSVPSQVGGKAPPLPIALEDLVKAIPHDDCREAEDDGARNVGRGIGLGAPERERGRVTSSAEDVAIAESVNPATLISQEG